MNVEQLENFNNILEKYKTGDEFLPARMMQTIPKSELGEIRTVREVHEYLAKKTGRDLQEVQLLSPTEWHRMIGDRRLARQHPFFEVLVDTKNAALLDSQARVIELTDKADDLIKKARKSRKTGIAHKIAPTDDKIVRWLESDADMRKEFAKGMTKAEMDAAEYMDKTFKHYYDYLAKRHAEKKFSRFENQYFPHIRRGFFEAWKDDGVIAAFKNMVEKYNQDAFVMNILNEKTQEILPYEKWIGFAQYRSGELLPTKNAASAFQAYVSALEKARHLDAFVPEVMAYVHALTPRTFSERGVELDTSLKKFVKEYVNANKGRVPKGFLNPGGRLDIALRGSVALTRMLDLGFNFTTQLAAPVGENVMTLTMLKPAGYKKAVKRAATKKGRAIASKYKEFTGRSWWDEMTRASNDIGDQLLGGMFAIYSGATKQANTFFLLGSMTDAEYASGTISKERLAELKRNMGKYRHVSGMESISGRTSEATALKQYKSWAIPPLTATIENANALAKMIRKDGAAKALSSTQGQELYYSIGLATVIITLAYSSYRELEENKDRNFAEDMVFKAMRDALSIYGAFDPTMWSGVRIADFYEDLANAFKDTLFMERYKSGELKGPKKMQRTLTPAILRRVQKEIQGDSGSTREGAGAAVSTGSLPKLPELPPLPKVPTLPKL